MHYGELPEPAATSDSRVAARYLASLVATEDTLKRKDQWFCVSMSSERKENPLRG